MEQQQQDRKSNNEQPEFVNSSTSHDGSKHSLGVTASGAVYSWGRNNELGQLGRQTDGSKKETMKPHPVEFAETNVDNVKAVRAFAGGLSDSGHSAILDVQGNLFMAGCDRWQQLGLGSSAGGASGYTWDKGRIWRDQFVRNDFLTDLMQKQQNNNNRIRDVALGGDHTVVLSTNKRDVYTFGKGGEGQLGLSTKPFVSAPQRSTILSSSVDNVAAVCATRHCSLTLDDNGNVLNKAGKCRMGASRGSESMANALKACIQRAERDGLIHSKR